MIRLTLREIANNRRFSLFFIFNLSLGLMGFLTLEVLESSLRSTISSQSKALAGADILISTRRDLNSNETQIIDEKIGKEHGILRTKVTDLFSMISFRGHTRLVQLRAIEMDFPLYGSLLLKFGDTVKSKTPKNIVSENKIWVYPELLSQLGLSIGDKVKIGSVEFTVDDVVERDAGVSFRRFSIAPRVYLGLKQLQRTGLVRLGSTISYTYLFRIPEDRDLDTLSAELNKSLSDPGIEASTHQTASDQTGRMLSYLDDYLGLVALVGLFLSGLGSAYLFRSFLSRRLKDMAVLLTLGLTRKEIQKIYLLQMAILGAAAGAVGLLISYAILPLLMEVIRTLTPFEISVSFSVALIFITIGIGVATSMLVGFPLLSRIQNLKPAELFRENAQPQSVVQAKSIVKFIPLIVVFWLLSMWQANSVQVGSIFVGTFWAASVVLGIIVVGSLKLLEQLNPRAIYLKLPLRSLARNRLSTISCFLALGLGTLLLNLIPQLQANLQAELQNPDRVLPSLFLFDIQEEQLGIVQKTIAAENLKLDYLSPLVRARIEAVNDQPFEKTIDAGRTLTREQEQEERSRNRGFNLSFRDKLSDSEELIEGNSFGQSVGEVAEISVEEKFAERLKFKIGDRLRFDIQGVPIEGKIVNLRRVRWTSFQPNFFVVFQPGFLDQAPKTYLASLGQMSNEKKERLQSSLVNSAPNVSIIDVERLIENILQISMQMSWALRFMAALSIFSGLVVLFSIANHQVMLRRWDLSLMKVLGTNLNDLYKIVVVEFGLLSFAAGISGAILSVAVSFFISKVIFSGNFDFSLFFLATAIVGTTLLGTIVAFVASRRTLNSKPLELLGAGQQKA